MKKLPGAIAVIVFLYGAAAWAETVYVDDMLRVGVRSEPASSEAPMVVLTTGEPVKVLEKNKGYLRIRTQAGVEGWVNGTYMTETPPARVRIGKVEAELAKSRDDLEQLRAAQARTVADNKKLDDRLTLLTKKNAKLREELDAFRDKADGRGYTWLWLLIAAVALFSLGIALGLRWYKQHIARRLGGLEL